MHKGKNGVIATKNPDFLIRVDVKGGSDDVHPKKKGPTGPRKPMQPLDIDIENFPAVLSKHLGDKQATAQLRTPPAAAPRLASEPSVIPRRTPPSLHCPPPHCPPPHCRPALPARPGLTPPAPRRPPPPCRCPSRHRARRSRRLAARISWYIPVLKCIGSYLCRYMYIQRYTMYIARYTSISWYNSV